MNSKDTVSIPAQARHLAAKYATAGFDGAGSLCWLFADAKLVVWAADKSMSSHPTASLPYPAPHAAVSVAALQVADGTISLEYNMNLGKLPVTVIDLCRRLEMLRLQCVHQTGTCLFGQF